MSRRVGTVLVVAMLAVGAVVTSWGAQVNAATTPPQVRVTAAGDFGEAALTQGVFAAMKTRNPDLALVLGDLSYGVTGTEQAWCDMVTARMGAGFPVELLAGNHESNGQNGNINDFSACLPNQLPGLVGTYGRQYYVDVPREAPLVRFVMISPNIPFTDSTWSYAAGTARYAWTAAAIDGARAKGVPWVVVGMHKPCLSVGEYGCEPGADVLNLLVSKKVDLVLTGHDHIYQRTVQLAHAASCPAIAPGAAASPACIADPDSSMHKGAGTVFATVATGGRSLHQISATDPEAPYFLASSGANVNPTWGFLDLTMTASELKASFVPTSGTFTDAFTIAAAPANTPPTPSFTATCAGLTCSVDASASSDPDGAITAYQWSFGDGTTGSGATATHGYGAGGHVSRHTDGHRRRRADRLDHPPGDSCRAHRRGRRLQPDGHRGLGDGHSGRSVDEQGGGRDFHGQRRSRAHHSQRRQGRGRAAQPGVRALDGRQGHRSHRQESHG